MIISEAPGRICLFGEHQDYLKLDVVAAAINLKFKITAEERNDKIFKINMPDINVTTELDPESELKYDNSRDYIKAVINVIKKEYNVVFDKGYTFTFTSTIPINAGASSSSVMLVAWTKLLLRLNNIEDYKDAEKVAYLAYLAEVEEFNEAGGMMDHYSSSIGNVVHIETKFKPVKCHNIDIKLNGFVLGHSLEPKDTVGVLKNLKSNSLESINKIKKYVSDFDFEKYTYGSIKEYVDKLESPYNKILKANLLNHEYAVKALEKFKTGNFTDRELGELLYLHHEQLRDGLGISTAKIEKMLDESMKAGGLGGKINGSGGGGTMFVYAPGKEQDVAEAIEKAGGKPYILEISPGARILE